MIVPEHDPSDPPPSRTLTRTTDVLAVMEHADPFTMAVPIGPHAPPGMDGTDGDDGKIKGVDPLVPPQLDAMNAASATDAICAAAAAWACRSSLRMP
jgi:hypothetical protein